MKSKFLKILISSLTLTVAFSSSVFASDSVVTKKTVDILKPNSVSEKVFIEVEMTSFTNGNEQILIKGHHDHGQAPQHYDIKIDKENKTYTATKMKGEELEKVEQAINKMETERNITSLSTTSDMHAGVIATTDDPADADLCETSQLLYWNSSGYVDRVKSEWAANPSEFDTHWFVFSKSWTPISYLDGGRTVFSQNKASYFNWDFLLDDQKTEVSHTISIYGYKAGGYNYDVSWTKSGEGNTLLDLDVSTW